MRTLRSAPLVTAEQPELNMVLVECLAADGTHYAPERNWERIDMKSTAQDIASGQIEDVHAAYEFGRSGSVTEDLARHVLGIVLDDHEEIPGPQRDWLETHLGCEVVARALREREAA